MAIAMKETTEEKAGLRPAKKKEGEGEKIKVPRILIQ
jgi:hypothetical protein